MGMAEIPVGAALIVATINTRYGQKRLHEEWPDHAAMAIWLHERGLLDTEVTVSEGDYRRLVALREALRTNLRRADEDASTADALATLNHLADHAVLRVHFTDLAQAQLAPESGGVDGVIARVLAAVLTSSYMGVLPRIKICQSHACSKAFYDGSKNHSAVWCSTRTCGNRMHARAYRQQKKAAT